MEKFLNILIESKIQKQIPLNFYPVQSKALILFKTSNKYEKFNVKNLQLVQVVLSNLKKELFYIMFELLGKQRVQIRKKQKVLLKVWMKLFEKKNI